MAGRLSLPTYTPAGTSRRCGALRRLGLPGLRLASTGSSSDWTGAAEDAFQGLALAAMGAATIADDGAVSVIVTWLGADLDAAA